MKSFQKTQKGCFKMAKHEEVKNGVIFPVGEKNEAYAQFFVGQSYLKTLVADPKVSVGVGNVTFEPGCRNNWHIHRDGFQLLLVTGGEGWYQEEGKPAQFLKAGDVIVTSPLHFYVGGGWGFLGGGVWEGGFGGWCFC